MMNGRRPLAKRGWLPAVVTIGVGAVALCAEVDGTPPTVAKEPTTTATRPVASAKPTPTKNPVPATKTSSRAALEKKFEQSLTGAVLEGVWQMTGPGGLKASAPLTDPRKERYAIASVEKAGNEHWIVTARIQYAERDVTVPVLVRVVWAGETPMITIDDLAIPLIGTYSARVIFHKGFYSGIWYSNGRNYGGVMSGRVVKPKDKEKDAADPIGK